MKRKKAVPSRRRLPREAESHLAENGISIAVTNRQRQWPIDKIAIKRAATCVLRGEGIHQADISVAVVGDKAIHKINRQFLNHDEPTDVITFLLDQAGSFLDGEIVVSAETAASSAERFGWSPHDELLLYVIHGALHLAGYDDQIPSEKRRMRSREKHYLKKLGANSPRITSAVVRSN